MDEEKGTFCNIFFFQYKFWMIKKNGKELTVKYDMWHFYGCSHDSSVNKEGGDETVRH